MTGPGVSIVPLVRGHVRHVMAIDSQVYPTPWSRKLWLTELGRDQRIYLVAQLDRSIVGYVGALVALEDLHIMTIVAEPEYQRLGIASRLLVAAISRGLEAGCTALTLEVRAGNDPAKALYRKFGIAPAGVRRDYYEPDDEDALVMWAHDIDGADYRGRIDRIEASLEAVA